MSAKLIPKPAGTMRVLKIYTAGGPPYFKLDFLRPKPIPKKGEILIRQRAFVIERSEMFTPEGPPCLQFPHILRMETVGTVEKASKMSEQIKVGDLVMTKRRGLQQHLENDFEEFFAVPATQVRVLGRSTSWEELEEDPASLTPVYDALFENMCIGNNKKLLVRGGISSMAITAAAIAEKHEVVVSSVGVKEEVNNFLRKFRLEDVSVEVATLSREVKKVYKDELGLVLGSLGFVTLEKFREAPHVILRYKYGKKRRWEVSKFGGAPLAIPYILRGKKRRWEASIWSSAPPAFRTKYKYAKKSGHSK